MSAEYFLRNKTKNDQIEISGMYDVVPGSGLRANNIDMITEHLLLVSPAAVG